MVKETAPSAGHSSKMPGNNQSHAAFPAAFHFGFPVPSVIRDMQLFSTIWDSGCPNCFFGRMTIEQIKFFVLNRPASRVFTNLF